MSSKLLVYFAIALYAASLTMPAFYRATYIYNIEDAAILCPRMSDDPQAYFNCANNPHEGPTVEYGYDMLLLDLHVLGSVAWMASSSLLLALVLTMTNRHRAGSIVALVGLALGVLVFLSHDAFPIDQGGGPMAERITSFAVGYYVWLSSFIMLMAYAFIEYRRRHRP